MRFPFLIAATLICYGSIGTAQNNQISRVTGGAISLLIHDEGGDWQSAASINPSCSENRTTMALQFLTDHPADGVTTTIGAKSGAQSTLTLADTPGRRVMVENPTAFLRDLVVEGRLFVHSKGGDLDGTSAFTLTEFELEGLYELAQRCQWADALPTLADAKSTLAALPPLDDISDIAPTS